jgi:DNA-binding CsgD family transcriptional regulator
MTAAKCSRAGLTSSPYRQKELHLNPEPGDPGVRELSVRARQVLQLLAEDKSMKRGSRGPRHSPRTVEFHKYRVMELLGVKTNAPLVQYAIKHGLHCPLNQS